MDNIQINYTFEMSNGTSITYPIVIDSATNSLIVKEQGEPPAWTELDNCRCDVCPLESDGHPYCPIAVNIAGLVECFKEMQSIEMMKITVETKERTYFKEAPAQRAIASILGIIMATSNCPVMDFLKPMARFHLPFSTSQETVIRSASMYLMSQYFIAKKGGKPDISLDGLNRAYRNVERLNEAMCRRIARVIKTNKKAEANSNAIVILDTFSKILSLAIEEKLDSVEYLFEGI
ncbi:MAG: hypothetical protein JW943_05440 [Deltaproteobacteria bacterium]|nr:hypothetical protein [Deltaproteobacteria bacterium]